MQTNPQVQYRIEEAPFARFDGESRAGKSATRRANLVAPRRHRDRLDYWLIFSACLFIFFPIAIVTWLLPTSRGAAAAGTPRSPWQSARRDAHYCAKLALQG